MIAPEHAPQILTTLPEKMSRMCRFGVDELQLVRFDREMADMKPEAFLDRLRETMDVRAVVAGWNYSFGRKAGGDAEMLRRDGEKYGYDVLIEQPVTRKDGTAISSSLIREELLAGNTEEADDLMGAPYTITGKVVEGKHEARTGVPDSQHCLSFKKSASGLRGLHLPHGNDGGNVCRRREYRQNADPSFGKGHRRSPRAGRMPGSVRAERSG